VAAAIGAAALAFAGGWQVRAWKAGNDEAAVLRAAQVAAEQHAQTAAQEATAHERTRQALQRALRQRHPAVDAALARPVCPDLAVGGAAAPALALGDVVVPADALGRLRVAAGDHHPDGAAGESGAALRPGPTDPDR
jgi:hypothetical protein